MVTYVITYAGRGRAEVLRLICEEAGLSYKNNTIAMESWPELKAKTPFGQIPVLGIEEEPEFQLAQSIAIARFLAKEGGIYPTDSKQAALADSVVDFVMGDVIAAFVKAFFSENKVEALKKFKTDLIPSFLEKLENILKKSGNTYFVNNKLSFADLYVFDLLEQMKAYKVDLAPYPSLSALFDAVAARPNISKYISNPARPPVFVPEGLQ